MFFLADRAHRRIALANLEVAFPQRSVDEREAIARAMFRHFGRLLLELLKYASLPPERQLGLVEWEGRRAREAGARAGQRAFCSAPAISASGNSRRWRTR